MGTSKYTGSKTSYFTFEIAYKMKIDVGGSSPCPLSKYSLQADIVLKWLQPSNVIFWLKLEYLRVTNITFPATCVIQLLTVSGIGNEKRRVFLSLQTNDL